MGAVFGPARCGYFPVFCISTEDNPFIAVLLGVTMGNEQVTFTQLGGLFIILLGVMLISRKQKKKQPPEPI
jgi:threonine/homoserine efflux transporter RhtA